MFKEEIDLTGGQGPIDEAVQTQGGVKEHSLAPVAGAVWTSRRQIGK